MKCLIALALICLPQLLPAQTTEKTDMEKDGLKGPVKQVSTHFYYGESLSDTARHTLVKQYDAQGNLLRSDSYRKAVLSESSTWEFNAHNQCTRYTYGMYGAVMHEVSYTYSPAGDLTEERWMVDGKLKHKYLQTFDAGHHLLRRMEYLNGKKTTRTQNTYDVQGRLIAHIEKTRRSEVEINEIFAYNAAGNLVRHTQLDAHDKPVTVSEYTYDAGNNRTSALYTQNGNSTGAEKTVYTYDAENRKTGERTLRGGEALFDYRTYTYGPHGLVQESRYDDNDVLLQQTIYSYDAKGNLLTKTTTGYKTRISRALHMQDEYTYDAQGNWLTLTETRDEKTTLTTREILYY